MWLPWSHCSLVLGPTRAYASDSLLSVFLICIFVTDPCLVDPSVNSCTTSHILRLLYCMEETQELALCGRVFFRNITWSLQKKKCLIKKYITSVIMSVQGEVTLSHSHDCDRTAALEWNFSLFDFYNKAVFIVLNYFFLVRIFDGFAQLQTLSDQCCVKEIYIYISIYISIIPYAKWIRNDMITVCMFSIL